MSAANVKSVLLATVLAFSATWAHADVITFESLAPPGSYKQMATGIKTVPLSGYALSFSGSGANYIYDSSYLAYSPYVASNGTDYLRLAGANSVTLTSTTSPLFTVNSIDLANYYYYNGLPIFDATATLTGTFADGSTISTAYSFSNNNIITTNDFTTEVLTGFTGLKSFKIAASGYNLDIDNIVINQAAAATNVPEPWSLAIVALGLVGIGAARRWHVA